MDEISVKALAKINLGLDVISRREDGYHEVCMIMQTIHLFDRLHLKKLREDQITLKTNLSFLPVDKSNLAYRAAVLLRDEFDIKEGIDIRLHKYMAWRSVSKRISPWRRGWPAEARTPRPCCMG